MVTQVRGSPTRIESVLSQSPAYSQTSRTPSIQHGQNQGSHQIVQEETTQYLYPRHWAGESQGDAANRLGLSSKGVWKAKQVQEREQRRLRNAERMERILIKTVEKTNPVSPNKWAVKKGTKTVQRFPFPEFPAEIRDMISQYSLLKLNNESPLSSTLSVQFRHSIRKLFMSTTNSTGLRSTSTDPPKRNSVALSRISW